MSSPPGLQGSFMPIGGTQRQPGNKTSSFFGDSFHPTDVPGVNGNRTLSYKTRGNLESFAEATAQSWRYVSSTAQKQTKSQGPSDREHSVLHADLCRTQANNRPWGQQNSLAHPRTLKVCPGFKLTLVHRTFHSPLSHSQLPASLPPSYLASVPKSSFENTGWIFQELPTAQSEDQTC